MVPTRYAVHIQGADFLAVSRQGELLSELPRLEESAGGRGDRGATISQSA